MLDIQFIRENAETVAAKAKTKGYSVDVQTLLKLDDQRRSLTKQIDQLRTERNQLSQSLKGGRPSDADQEHGRQLKEKLGKLEAEFKKTEEGYFSALKAVPNMPLDSVPIGQSEADNQIIKTVGEQPAFDFKPKAHYELGEERGLIDKARAAKIAGSRFVYLKGDLVRLQLAIMNYVMAELTSVDVVDKVISDNDLKLEAKAFIPILPPAMLKTEPYLASDRLNAEEMTYKIEQDDLWLNASAEHTLCTMYMDEIINEADLPLRLIGYSTSFRREAGSYGKDVEGIFRLHQFDKLEMEVLSTAETGFSEHQLLIALQEHLLSQLGLPYQLINKCTADIGKPNASGLDINTWFPSQQAYRETHTADFMTDYQTRDLKIRTRRSGGQLEFVHTNDATAFALGRIIAAIIENYQTSDGHIMVPAVLRHYMGGQEQI